MADAGALFHPVQTLAISGAASAHFSADPASEMMQVGAAQHEIGAGLANLRAVQHEPKMPWLEMFSAGFQTMVHRHL